MMEILKTPAEHVVAFSFDGKLTEPEFEQVAARIDEALRKNERVNLVCDITNLSGLTPQAALKDLLYGFSSLGQLYRFQRMATITDSSLVEALVRFEDRIFSGLELKTFAPDERDEALAWSEARIELPSPGLTLLPDEQPNLLRWTVGQEITGFDIRRAAALIRERYEAHGPVNLLVEMGKMPRLGPGIYYEKFKALQLLPLLGKYAVIGPDWLRTWVGTVGSAVSVRLRYFPPSLREQALAWLQDTSPTVELLPSERAHVVAMRLTGKLDGEAVRSCYHLLLPYLRGTDEIDVLLEVSIHEGLGFTGVLEALKLGIRHFSEVVKGVRRIAVVTDSGWIAKAVDLENLLLPGIEERPFSFAQKELALSWLHEGRDELAPATLLLPEAAQTELSPSS